MVPFYPQETRYSCVPACLRMVMAQLGVTVDEATLRDCCKTDRMGTTVKDCVNCAQRYGFHAFAAVDVTNDQLLHWLADRYYPIIYLNLFPLDTIWVTHAVIVETIDNQVVTFVDPIAGRRQATTTAFEQAWQMTKGQVIVIGDSHV